MADDNAALLETLRWILRSGNDNDPRLDSDFNHLSPRAKRLFRREYLRTPPEGFNQRGTIVYLLGRNLVTDEDWGFFRAVVGQAPCLSLADCSKESRSEDPDHFAGIETTLAYPQIVALRQAARTLQDAREKAPMTVASKAAGETRALIGIALKSSMPALVREAAALENSL